MIDPYLGLSVAQTLDREYVEAWWDVLRIEHDLDGWRVEWYPRLRTTLGKCTWGLKLIKLNTLHPDSASALETLKHEIAHALTPPPPAAAKHGPEWAANCEELGIAPQRLGKLPEELVARLSPTRWRVVCPSCGFTKGFRRRPSRLVPCPACDFPTALPLQNFRDTDLYAAWIDYPDSLGFVGAGTYQVLAVRPSVYVADLVEAKASDEAAAFLSKLGDSATDGPFLDPE